MIHIRKRTQAEWLIWFIGFFPLICQFLVTELKAPGSIRYSIDVALFILILLLFKYQSKYQKNIFKTSISKWIGVFFVYTLVNYFFNYQSAKYYLWGFRNNFRFYIFFLLCLTFLSEIDVAYFVKLFNVFFWLNVIVVTYQNLVLKLYQDNLGGLFGTESGSNGYMNIFLVIICSKAMLDFINKRKKVINIVPILFGSIYIAALAEMKAFFIELILIAVISSLVTHFTFRKLILILGVFAVTMIGINILVSIFPGMNIFSIEGIITASSGKGGYTNSGDLNRLTGIQTLIEKYIQDERQVIFGLGLGNCDYSDAISWLRTPYFEKYSWLHYTWMSTTFIFVELGIVGLVFLFGFFIIVFIEAGKIAKDDIDIKEYSELAQTIAAICIFFAIYNSTLRTEAGYMAYLFMSFPFVVKMRKYA